MLKGGFSLAHRQRFLSADSNSCNSQWKLRICNRNSQIYSKYIERERKREEGLTLFFLLFLPFSLFNIYSFYSLPIWQFIAFANYVSQLRFTLHTQHHTSHHITWYCTSSYVVEYCMCLQMCLLVFRVPLIWMQCSLVQRRSVVLMDFLNVQLQWCVEMPSSLANALKRIRPRMNV